MDLQDVFISNLKTIRKERLITQEKLAELCNTDTAYIGQIETRKRFPSISLIEKIAAALNVEPYRLFKNNSTSKNEDPEKLNALKKEFLSLIDTDIEEFLKKHCKIL